MAQKTINPFSAKPKPAAVLSKEQALGRLVASVVPTIQRVARDGLRAAYDQLRRDIYGNPQFSAEEAYAAIGEPASSQLKQFAVLAKTVCNLVAVHDEDKIVDDVPEAKITLPQE